MRTIDNRRQIQNFDPKQQRNGWAGAFAQGVEFFGAASLASKIKAVALGKMVDR